MENSVEFRHISKYFPGVKALDDVSFKAVGGEVVAMCGENGAGKSTLLKVLNGDYRADEGQYLINGKEVFNGKVKGSKKNQKLAHELWGDPMRNFKHAIEVNW